MTDSKLPLAEALDEIADLLECMMSRDKPTVSNAAALLRQQHEALVRADEFISNGIEFGYIQMPDADCPDAAHETLGLIEAAIAAAEGKS